LRSAKDIYKNGGHVTEKLRDQKVRVLFDNRREIIESKDLNTYDMSNCLLDSKPLKTKEECLHFRFLSKFSFLKPFLRNSPNNLITISKYRSYLEVGVRNFIKGYLAKEPCFGLKGTEFKTYGEIIHFICGFTHAKCIKISRQSISQLKQRRLILRPVPKTEENKMFALYIATLIPYFDVNSFLKDVK